jgi:hypothetical protein
MAEVEEGAPSGSRLLLLLLHFLVVKIWLLWSPMQGLPITQQEGHYFNHCAPGSSWGGDPVPVGT